MIKRYADEKIDQIWANPNKLFLWQKTELAVIEARCQLGIYPQDVYEKINKILLKNQIDIDWWLVKDKEIRHDLNAFIDERIRHLPAELHQYFHDGMTSYDTEEPATALMLIRSVNEVEIKIIEMENLLKNLALKYQYSPMLGRTHGQEAKIQSVGKRFYSYYQNFQLAVRQLKSAKELLQYSKLSGAVGNYQGVTPEEEKKALSLLGLKPFKGATQIMPRSIFKPIIDTLEQIVYSLTQITEDIRLNARSGLPLMHEPFAKKQKGSSAMPHKKNTIKCEQQIGMLTMSENFASMLRQRILTWEERAIEQSCVERVAFPDLFHIVLRSFYNVSKILKEIPVFTDNMMIEILNSKGCYASEEAKNWLKVKGAEYGLAHEDAYRIVQLAAFLAHLPDKSRQELRQNPPQSYQTAESNLKNLKINNQQKSIEIIIANGELEIISDLELNQKEINRWKEVLSKIFANKDNLAEWQNLFSISYHLRNEKYLFEDLN